MKINIIIYDENYVSRHIYCDGYYIAVDTSRATKHWISKVINSDMDFLSTEEIDIINNMKASLIKNETKNSNR